MLHIYQCVMKIFHRRSYGISFERSFYAAALHENCSVRVHQSGWQLHCNAITPFLPHVRCTRASPTDEWHEHNKWPEIVAIIIMVMQFIWNFNFICFSHIFALLAIELMRCSGAFLILPTLSGKFPRRTLFTFPREGANPGRKLEKRTTHSSNPFHKHIARF